MEIKKIFKIIYQVSKKNKTPVYIVGGFVRDYLMGKISSSFFTSKNNCDLIDLDFVVVGSGLEFAKKLDTAFKEKGSLVEFPDFDTARYIIKPEDEKKGDNIVLEFAGARSEVYEKDSRKPKVNLSTLENDLKRRDFKVNAMAIQVGAFLGFKIPAKKNILKNLIDPLKGLDDLNNKILLTPLDPKQTFSDDPLRMMRAIRFSAQLNFSIEKKVLDAIFTEKERLKIVSSERVQEELLKLLSCEKPSVGLLLMFQTHILDYVLPEVSKLDGVEEIYGHQHKNNLTHTFKVVDNLSKYSDNIMLRFAALLHDIGKSSTKKFVKGIGWTFYQHEHLGKKMVYQIGKRLHLSKNNTDYLAKIVRWHQQPISLMDKGITDSAVRRLVVNLGDELNDLLILGRSDITTGNPYKKEKRLKNYDNLEKRIFEVEEKDKLRAFQSPVRGEEIMKECNLKSGPTVGEIKKDIEEAILDGKIKNEHDEAKKYFEKIKNKYLKKAQEWEKIKN